MAGELKQDRSDHIMDRNNVFFKIQIAVDS